MQGFRGNYGFPGKLEMCPSLAESDTMRFPRIKNNFTAIFSRFPSDFHTNLRKSEEWRKRFARHKERSVLYGSIAASTGNL